MDTKKCKRCGKDKPLEEFYLEKLNKDGRQGSCIACMKAHRAAYRAQHRERVRAQSAKWFAEHPDAHRNYQQSAKGRAARKSYNTRNRERISKSARNWRHENEEFVRELEREARQKPDAKAKASEKQKEKYRNSVYRLKCKARYAVLKAIERGELTRPTKCPACGRAALISAHHEDYSKPLDIEWLCQRCHSQTY